MVVPGVGGKKAGVAGRSGDFATALGAGVGAGVGATDTALPVGVGAGEVFTGGVAGAAAGDGVGACKCTRTGDEADAGEGAGDGTAGAAALEDAEAVVRAAESDTALFMRSVISPPGPEFDSGVVLPSSDGAEVVRSNSCVDCVGEPSMFCCVAFASIVALPPGTHNSQPTRRRT